MGEWSVPDQQKLVRHRQSQPGFPSPRIRLIESGVIFFHDGFSDWFALLEWDFAAACIPPFRQLQ